MRLTSHTDYGLRVLMYLAVREDHLATAPEIAEAHGLSLHHLRKVIQALAQAELVTTSRGRGGGVQLARPSSEIRVGEVVRALETDLDIVECFGTGPVSCAIAPACRLKVALRGATEAFLSHLDQISLAEVCRNGSALRRLLGAQAPERECSG
ncbi:MAG: Rrf2 family transcriptional regulator [Alphaproteobacteria bacterium]|nr:Rrf2 family transcriptional regulator [Alphaproteobacteria bacterium]